MPTPARGSASAGRRERLRREVRQKLEDTGCYFIRHGRGDHDVWHSPINDRRLTVPVKITSRHMANKVLKDAGLPKAF